MLTTIRSKLVLTLLVPLVVLVPVALFQLAATRSSRHTSVALARSADVLQSTQKMLLGAVDSETGADSPTGSIPFGARFKADPRQLRTAGSQNDALSLTGNFLICAR